MAEYRFVTVWRFKQPIERVWRAINQPDRYREWWPNILDYRRLTPLLTGVGAQGERVVKGRLPYQLRYTTTITDWQAPTTMAYTARGDLEGDGRFELQPAPDGTQVTIHWNVQTRGRWLNVLAPALRWLFAWNHHQVMAAGERGLARWLDANLDGD